MEHNRIPRPKIAAPRAISHNHIIAIDLKENRRYKNAPPYILYIFDVFSRFKAACFINNKRGETIAEHLVTEWIKHHGPPKYIMSDRGNEFLNTEVQDMCQIYGIKYTTTAAYSPHQNGLVERGHATADRALERMMTADPRIKPQLVFGRIPRHPFLVKDNPEGYWKGPAKVVLKDGKSLHCILEGNSLIINSDDVLLNKPGDDPEYEEHFTFLPSKQQPPASIISNQSSQPELEAGVEKPNDAKDVTPLADTTKASVPKNYDAHTKLGLVLQTGTEATSQVGRFDSNQQLTNSILLHEPPSHWGHDLPSI